MLRNKKTIRHQIYKKHKQTNEQQSRIYNFKLNRLMKEIVLR